MRLYFLIFTVLLISQDVRAVELRGHHMVLRVPESWVCREEGEGWSCHSSSSKDKVANAVLIQNRVARSDDTLAALLKEVEKPRQWVTSKGHKVVSKVLQSKQGKWGDYLWVEALHWQAVRLEHYTQYFATENEMTAVYLTASGGKVGWQPFLEELEKVVGTLKTYR